MSRRVRLPSPADLHQEPPLGPLLLLELAAAVAANALRAQHVAIEGDHHPAETAEITTARVLARECDLLRDTLHDYRRRVLARLDHERRAWPF
ncbi:MAG: hypothetical protein HS111_11940 [Kofleriaceae bacterium]|nr:hypothetical protein [Kofleriaceae bacterium]MCL4227273.1 hypothetical protein [Myxococcales bacterium]